MKNFFSLDTIIILLVFIIGLIATGTSGNWVAFVCIVTGMLWSLICRWHELDKEDLKLTYEAKIAELRLNRDEYMKLYKSYWDKYDAKLKENYDLACDNKRLAEDNERLTKLNLELSEKDKHQETPVQGSLKVKVKKKKPIQMREQ